MDVQNFHFISDIALVMQFSAVYKTMHITGNKLLGREIASFSAKMQSNCPWCIQ